MRNFILTLLLLQAVNLSAVPLTKQEIRYRAENAEAVSIVWGVNGWSKADKSSWPSGTVIEEGLLSTPMMPVNGEFTATLFIPQGTTLDYIFHITKGPAATPVDIWDLNTAPFKDYHLLAWQNSTVVHRATVKAEPAQQWSLLDSAGGLFFISSLVLLALLIFSARRIKQMGPLSTPVVVGVVFFVCFIFLAIIRASVAGYGWKFFLEPFTSLPVIFSAAHYDLLVTLACASAFMLACIVLHRSGRALKVVRITAVSSAMILVLAALVNIRVVEMLGKPFTYQWLHYADFLQSTDAQLAMSENLSSEYIWKVAGILVSFVVVAISVLWIASMMRVEGPRRKIAWGMSVLLVCSYTAYSFAAIKEHKVDYNRLSNPLAVFTGSFGPFNSTPTLFEMQVPDSLKFVAPKEIQQSSFPGIRNVVYFVMESTPAELISCYGSKYKVTPNLEKYSSSAITFKNVYAHAPATNSSMVSLLASTYPWISTSVITQEAPDAPLETVSAVLKGKGYRTGFFNSADNRFQRADEFLSCRKFDQLEDCNSNTCDGKQFHVEDKRWKFLNGKDDACTANGLLSWISEKPQNPFFAMMWTYQTHYPYFSSGEEIMFEPHDKPLNRYLNALHHSDRVFGQLMTSLEKLGLLQSTLVVVVGDHGEAFGRHDQKGHASRIYEENLHVPCMLFNPAFKKQDHDGIGGIVDVSPTVLNILNISSPESWHGQSLLSRTKNDRVYFFAPWSDYLFGFREGDRKFIYNATRDVTEVYQLDKDPLETTKIEITEKERQIGFYRLAAWAQFANSGAGKMLP
jgi:arylsulfatase A-like enzyme